jgi:hypothetical protein
MADRADIAALAKVVEALRTADAETRAWVLHSARTYFERENPTRAAELMEQRRRVGGYEDRANGEVTNIGNAKPDGDRRSETRRQDCVEVCETLVRVALQRDPHNGMTQTGEVTKDDIRDLVEMALDALDAKAEGCSDE